MHLPASILGQRIARDLTARTTAAILTIGSDTFSRKDLAGVDCFNFVAAFRLSVILQQLQAKHTRDVFDNVQPSALALPGLGAVSLAVLGAAFSAKKLGGDEPLVAWVRKHATDVKQAMVTFGTIKHRHQQEVQEERKARKKRKAQRRDQAHRIRKDRFAAQQPGGIH